MTPSLNAINIIKQWESLRLRAYKPIPFEKFYSIGYGHCSSEVKRNQVITTQQAELLLQQDLSKFSEQLSDYCPKLKQYQYDALCSLIYNIGWYAFRYSQTGNLAHYCNITRAPEEVARRIVFWVKSKDQVLLGLQRRRVFEANYFLGYDRFFLDETTQTINEYNNQHSTFEL